MREQSDGFSQQADDVPSMELAGKKRKADAEMSAVDMLLMSRPVPTAADPEPVRNALNVDPGNLTQWLTTLTPQQLTTMKTTIDTTARTGNVEQIVRNNIEMVREFRELDALATRVELAKTWLRIAWRKSYTVTYTDVATDTIQHQRFYGDITAELGRRPANA